MSEQQSRRKFLKNSALLAAGTVLAPSVIPASARGANDRITIGMIGTGNHGIKWNMSHLFNIPDCQIVAVCDVDERRMENAQSIVHETYGKKGCKTYTDFRDLLEQKDIDAVQISTPDHWHVHQAIMSMQAGKDVICEKPTWNIRVGRELVEYLKNSDRIFQTSLEDRSLDPYYRMAMLARNGHIGKIKKMNVKVPGAYHIEEADTTIQPVPDYFNWDLWLGPAPYSPYSPGKTHRSFRWVSDYGVGSIADWGAHMIDTAQWANGTEKWGPIEVKGKGSRGNIAYFDNFNKFDLTYRYENGVELGVQGDGNEIHIEGTEGWLLVKGWNQPLQASDEDLLSRDLSKDPIQLYTAKGEHANFINCIKSRKKPYHPAEDMHRTATISHIGVIAMTLKRKLRWDPEKEAFIKDEEANAMRADKERDPWKLKHIRSA